MSDTQTLIENRPPSVADLPGAGGRHAGRRGVPLPGRLPAAGEGPDDWKSLTWAQAAERVGCDPRPA
ncbi:AMP-dependent synthetase/ligase [Streptomyces violaceorubidus]